MNEKKSCPYNCFQLLNNAPEPLNAVGIPKINAAVPATITAFFLEKLNTSIKFATNTSSNDIEDVKAVKIKRMKKTVEIIKVAGSLENRMGSV